MPGKNHATHADVLLGDHFIQALFIEINELESDKAIIRSRHENVGKMITNVRDQSKQVWEELDGMYVEPEEPGKPVSSSHMDYRLKWYSRCRGFDMRCSSFNQAAQGQGATRGH